jgi:hypothetical protein
VYDGSIGDGKALLKWVLSHVPQLFTLEVTGANVQHFISAAVPPKRKGECV